MISTRRVSDQEIRARLGWLRSSGVRIAGSRRVEGRTPALAASMAATAAGKELGGRALRLGAQVVQESARRIRDYLRAGRGQNLAPGQNLRILPEAGAGQPPGNGLHQPSQLDTRDGAGPLEWDAESRRWRFAGPDPGSRAARIPRIRIDPPHSNGETRPAAAPRRLRSRADQ
jgi:hypothetical protein